MLAVRMPVWPRLVAAIVCAVALVALTGAGSALAAKKPTAKSTLKALAKQTNRLPKASASAKKRAQLKRLAVNARRKARRRPCASVHALAEFRRVLSSVPVKRKAKGRRLRAAQKLSALGPASVEASRLLLASRKTRRCGGGVKPPTGKNPKVRLLKSDAESLRVRVQLPAIQFVSREGGGQAWTELKAPKSDSPGTPGTPGIPVVSDVLAVPDGAQMRVRVNDTDKLVIEGVDVYPIQPDPVDQDTEPPNFFKAPYADRPFQLNRAAYNRDRAVPAKPADADFLGAMRDINLGALQIPTAQYNPDSKKLTLLKSVDVTVRFAGGPHTFSESLSDAWELNQRRLFDTLLNRNILTRIPIREYVRRCGEEMLVITNPATRTAADTFAAARSAAGIRTRVFETGTGSTQVGTTAAQIQTFIRARLANFPCIRPSYVTLMGDDDLVPVFPGINGIPSDLEYSLSNPADELPDLAVGRILGNDQAAVGTAVNKIISYENSPPGGNWTRRATIAAQFQDDNLDGTENRTFIQFAETVRNGILSGGFGLSVDRIYQDSPTADPKKFNDGTDLPAALQKPTFAWNGSGTDVTNAWNAGRYLMIHRDHGYSDGWGHPGFNTANVQALTNGNVLPVLMSINCSSGAFDYDETSFASEALVHPNGGSVGVFGDTRDSPTWHNTQIAWGFVDALIPRVLPSEGPAAKQRVGNALIHGKMRLAGLAPPSGPGITGGDGNTRNELYLWHYFGDPSMQMWGGDPPAILDPSRFRAVFLERISPDPPPDPPPFWVQVTLPPEFNGQAFSLLRDGGVVGKGIAHDGVANIPASLADDSGPAGRLMVAFEADGSPPILIPVQETQTTLTQKCPADEEAGSNETVTITGNLAGAPANSTVDVSWTMRDRFENVTRTVETHPKTDSQGNWSTSVDSESFEHGTWTVSSRYAGTQGYAPSETGPCSFTVQDQS